MRTKSEYESLRVRLRRLADASTAADQVAEDARESRDAAIEAAELAGLTVREIAALTGLSRARAGAIVIARAATRQEEARRALGL